jgi:rhamnosyl/mannosyltransferase
LVSYKGLEILVRALEDSKARLWIVGAGPLEDSLKSFVKQKGLAERVVFLGQVSESDLVAYYHACDVFVLPSITNAEMFGVVQLEAMACRKPVISTDLPTGVSWVNQHLKTGFVVPPNNVAELANAIQILLNNPALRQEMGEAGRRRVEQQFTSAKMAEAMLQVYQGALDLSCRGRVLAKAHRAEEIVARPAKLA